MSALSPRLVARYGRHRVMIVFSWLHVFPLGLTFTQPGVAGLLTVITVEGLAAIATSGALLLATPLLLLQRDWRHRLDRQRRVDTVVPDRPTGQLTGHR